MSSKFLTTMPGGELGIIYTRDDDPLKIAKNMFELSRDGSDMLTHFDPDIHTLDAIETGIVGHHSMVCREIDDADIPSDRTFRDAWEDTGGSIQVNMTNARTIHMDRIRVIRNAKLGEIDKQISISEDQGAKTEVIKLRRKRQLLRDIPQTFDLGAFSTPDELKGAWPDELT